MSTDKEGEKCLKQAKIHIKLNEEEAKEADPFEGMRSKDKEFLTCCEKNSMARND